MLLPWVSALCYGGTGPYVAVRLREQGETMLTGDEVYYGVGPVPTSFHLAARKGWLEQAFRRCGARLINLGDIPLMQEKHYTHRSPNLIRLGGNFPTRTTTRTPRSSATSPRSRTRSGPEPAARIHCWSA